MADGPAAYLADAWLTWLGGNAGTAPAALYFQLHTGAPGAAGTASVSSVTTREALTLGTPSGGSVASSGTATWSSWAGTNGEVLTDLSVWDATTAGNFLDSVALSASKTVNTGDTFEVTSFTMAFTIAS